MRKYLIGFKITSISSFDLEWKPNSFYSRGTEGFAFGKINNDGYNNAFNYSNNMKIQVLIMGSSHMEAYQVQPNESTAGLLNSMLGSNTVYNIGVSNHTFLTIANHLQNAIQKYKPTKFIIIETSSIAFKEQDLRNVLNGTFEEIPLKNNQYLLSILQKNQFLRLAYKQSRELINNSETNTKDIEKTNTVNNNDNSKTLLNELLFKMSNSVSISGIKLIIVYHPKTTINADGSLQLSNNSQDLTSFKEMCQKNNIYFLDMSERFLEEYNDKHILPYGFTNSSIGSGHLNKYGHKMLAEELYKTMQEVK